MPYGGPWGTGWLRRYMDFVTVEAGPELDQNRVGIFRAREIVFCIVESYLCFCLCCRAGRSWRRAISP